jgi:hypothetical protein
VPKTFLNKLVRIQNGTIPLEAQEPPISEKKLPDTKSPGIVVVLIRHPGATKDEPDTYLEIYVPREKLKNRNLHEGDYVSADVEEK